MKLNNKYFILRHGQALSNVKEFNSSWPEKVENPLTKKGRREAQETAKKLKIYAEHGRSIDLIFSSDLGRAKQTAEIIGKAIGIEPKFDKRLREISFGIYNGQARLKLNDLVKTIFRTRKKNKEAGQAENYYDVAKRMFDFLKEIDKKYNSKNILIISHEAPLVALEWKVKGISIKNGAELKNEKIRHCEVKKLN
jgi:broad specificity phosphatase PhoE